jgi:hypothetical protein
MDRAYLERCEREDLEPETMWLSAADLEPAGAAPAAEAPRPAAELIVPPAGDDRAARIRELLGEDGPGGLPPVDEARLRRYRRWLADHLPLPRRGRYDEDFVNFPGKGLPLRVVGLAREDQCVGEFGVLAEVEVGSGPDGGKLLLPLSKIAMEDEDARRPVQDYAFWFYQGQPPPGAPEDLLGAPVADRRLVWRLVQKAGLAGAIGGAVSGAILNTSPEAGWICLLGVALLGVVGYLLGTRFGLVTGVMYGVPYGAALGGVFGTLAGGLAGVVLGALVSGFVGALPGSIAGNLLGALLGKVRWNPLSRLSWTIFGAAAGGLAEAFWVNRDQALAGAGVGALVGMAAAIVLLVALLATVLAVTARRG